jgi:hypoxanthine-DNA glycosylase
VASSDCDEALTAGFPPILGKTANVLILGSLPSRRSIETNQYYGHPRNAFWPVMGALFGAEPSLPYESRVQMLIDCQVAVWDVLAASIRPGSMDAAIDTGSARPNDFATLFAAQPGVQAVFFNGQAAARLFARLVAPTLENGSNRREYQVLPSTSPAHAAMRIEQKIAAWRCVATAVNNNKGE